MTERRRFLRFETSLNAICDFVSEAVKATSRIRNISKEGALLVMDKKLRNGAELNLTMDVPGDNVPIFATCEVAWQKDSGKDSSYETGVKFTKMNNADKGRLLEYIYTQWLKLLDRNQSQRV